MEQASRASSVWSITAVCWMMHTFTGHPKQRDEIPRPKLSLRDEPRFPNYSQSRLMRFKKYQRMRNLCATSFANYPRHLAGSKLRQGACKNVRNAPFEKQNPEVFTPGFPKFTSMTDYNQAKLEDGCTALTVTSSKPSPSSSPKSSRSSNQWSNRSSNQRSSQRPNPSSSHSPNRSSSPRSNHS